jgi:FkbM family methyltransferase
MPKLLKTFVYSVLSMFSIYISHVYGGLSKDSATLKYNLVKGLPDIYLDAQSEKIGHTWTNGYVWEKHLIQKFYSLLPKDDFFVVFDLGAQTGCFSLLAKYFPNSTWYSFEPIEEAATTLKKNLMLNDVHNVFVYQTAVADISGKITLKMPAMHEWGLATIGPNVLRFTPVSQREVDCIDLDSFIAVHNIKKIHFMKLDTEGSELYILRGARKMIMRDLPIILMEYNETNMKQCGVCKEDIHVFLAEMGYEWQLVSNEDILCIPIKALTLNLKTKPIRI